MSNEIRRIWAVCCGAIRLDFELFNILAILCDWRSQGEIEGIILSTWRGEVDKIPYLRKKLTYLDIKLVETTPLDESEGKYTNLNYARQAIQLNAAVSLLSSDAFVLKCRTDLCVEYLKKMRPFLSVNLEVGSYGCFEPPLGYRIAILSDSLSLPFWFNDLVFLGHKNDVKKLLQFEDTVKSIGKTLNSDLLWWISVFWHDFPIIQEYMSIANMWVTNKIIKTCLNQFTEKNFYLPGILNKLYALYFIIVFTSFYIVSDQYSGTDKHTFYEMVYISRGNGAPFHVRLYNFDAYSNLVYGNAGNTSGYAKLCLEMNKISVVPGYAKRMGYTWKDYQEANEWCKAIHFPIREWLGGWNKVQVDRGNQITFAQASKILFSEYKVQQEAIENMEEFCMGTLSYFPGLETALECFQDMDRHLYEEALLVAARGRNGKVLKKIACMLYQNQFEGNNIEKARIVFERYKPNSILLKAKTADHMVAFYYYGKYMIREKDSCQYEKSFYLSLRSEWNMTELTEAELSDYPGGVLELARAKREMLQQSASQEHLIEILSEFIREVDASEVNELIVKKEERNEGNRTYN